MPPVIQLVRDLAEMEHVLEQRVNLTTGRMIKACPNALAEIGKYEKGVEKRMFVNFGFIWLAHPIRFYLCLNSILIMQTA